MEATAEVSTDDPAGVRGASTSTVADAPVESTKATASTPRTPRRTTAKPSVDPELVPFMEQAERMVADGIVARKTPQEIAAVIRAIDEGATDNAIKKAGIASAGTAQRVRAELEVPARRCAARRRRLIQHPDQEARPVVTGAGLLTISRLGSEPNRWVGDRGKRRNRVVVVSKSSCELHGYEHPRRRNQGESAHPRRYRLGFRWVVLGCNPSRI